MKILKAQRATADSVAPFGRLVGAQPGVAPFMSWPGAEVFHIPFDLSTESEMLACRIDVRPMRVSLMERHFKHTQAFLPLDGKPFVMVLAANDGDLPDVEALTALCFEDACGIVLHCGVWHEFPFVLSDDTRFSVILSAQSHLSTAEHPAVRGDGDGPDLQRRNLALREGFAVTVEL